MVYALVFYADNKLFVVTAKKKSSSFF